jgi:hypothetical protein
VHSFYPDRSEFSHEPLLVVDTDVSQMSRQPLPTERFRMEYNAPGTAIADSRLPGAEKSPTGRLDYMIPADKAQLDAIIERSGSQIALRHDIEMNRRWRARLELACVVGAVVLAGSVSTWVTLRWLKNRRRVLER